MPSRRNACNFLLFPDEGMKEAEGFFNEKLHDKRLIGRILRENEAFEALFIQT